MKRAFLIPTLVLCVLTFAPGPVAAAAAPEEAAVRRFVEELGAAFGHNDPAAIERMLTSDYTFVLPSGAVQNREQRLAPLKSGDLEYESVTYEDVSVRVHGDLAVVVARVVVKGKNKGNDIGGQFRSTLTLVKVKGQWQLVASQASSIGPP
jgi:ketosteroid isomerase-like protein